jgi:hypothetical protein
MKLKTWHYEHAVIVTVLAIVWIATGHEWRELLGSVAVYLGHGCSSIGSRMEEQEALRDKPSVECFRQYWRYYIGKEIAWFGYFVWSGAWSALVGCVLFALYPFWRKYWRKRHPLKPKTDGGRTVEYASKTTVRIQPTKIGSKGEGA